MSPSLNRREFGVAVLGAAAACLSGCSDKNHGPKRAPTAAQMNAYATHEKQLENFLQLLQQKRVRLDRYFADGNIEVACMDEGDEPDATDDTVVKFGMAGTGAKAKPEELTEFAGRARRDRAFAKRLWKIIYHEACAAHGGDLEAAMQMAYRLAELLGLPKDVVQRDGFSEQAQRKMTRPKEFHITRAAVLDDTGRFQEHKLPMHTLDISTRHVPYPYLRRQLQLGGQVIEGEHGFGPVLSAQDKIVLLTVAENAARIDEILSQTEQDGWGTFKHGVEHVPILMPK